MKLTQISSFWATIFLEYSMLHFKLLNLMSAAMGAYLQACYADMQALHTQAMYVQRPFCLCSDNSKPGSLHGQRILRQEEDFPTRGVGRHLNCDDTGLHGISIADKVTVKLGCTTHRWLHHVLRTKPKALLCGFADFTRLTEDASLVLMQMFSVRTDLMPIMTCSSNDACQ